RRRGRRGQTRCVDLARHELAVLVLLATPRSFRPLEHVFCVTGGATGLSNPVIHNCDDRVVRYSSFPWTVIVHEVAKTQRALLHSILPTNSHFRIIPRHERDLTPLVGRRIARKE